MSLIRVSFDPLFRRRCVSVRQGAGVHLEGKCGVGKSWWRSGCLGGDLCLHFSASFLFICRNYCFFRSVFLSVLVIDVIDTVIGFVCSGSVLLLLALYLLLSVLSSILLFSSPISCLYYY